MKLRTRTPGRVSRPEPEDDVEVPPESRSARKAARTPRAAPAARPRPRTAPRGGVQKRKVSRPTPRQARPRPAAAAAAGEPQTPTTTTTTRSRPRPPRRAAAALKAPADMPPPDQVADVEVKPASSKEEARPTTIDDLPEEVMVGIFSYFRPPQLCWKIGRVCRKWASWSVAGILWKDKEYTLSPDPSLSSRRKN